MSEPRLLIITVPPNLESKLSDWLIDQDPPIGFSSVAVNGHGMEQESFTLAEQVRGSRRRIQFQVQTEAERADILLKGLARDFPGADMHFWMIPLLAIESRVGRPK
ncbi:MAG TPA: DUF3240 domain-containing protein [Acetobacteraceae bacterium]|jgi:hypothetical protein|nr:DUF3240 domain-containing protein [Acetobacteraceae bacterium]